MSDHRGTDHDGRARWALPATLAVLATAIELSGDAARVAMRYERGAVADGEWWRLVTGNLAHLGPRHLVLNLVGLALIGALGGRMLEGRRGATITAVSLLGVGVGLFAFAPGVGWYVGLSGALHGMLAAVALDACFDRAQRGWGLALAGALVAKLMWEQVAGPLPFTAAAAGGPVIVAAHLHGALAGALAAVVFVVHDRRRARPVAQV